MLNKNIIIAFVRDHFSEHDIKQITDTEIRLNSPFHQDTKGHLGISLKEGKMMGIFNVFKPPTSSGNFYKLVSMMIEKDEEEAKMYILEKYLSLVDIAQLYNTEDEKLKKNMIKKGYLKIDLPDNVEYVLQKNIMPSMYSHSFLTFLRNKGIDDDTIMKSRIMYGYEGRFRDFLIIPFFDDLDNIIYWVGRNIKEKKYDNAPNKIAAGKGSGIAYNVFTNEKIVVLTEGIFDALRLKDNGIALLGNKITEDQVEMIMKKEREKIIVAMDNYNCDEAGKEGVLKTIKLLAEGIKGTNTKLYSFNWNSRKYIRYKDFSRCPFEITLANVLDNSEKDGFDSDFNVNFFSSINNLKMTLP